MTDQSKIDRKNASLFERADKTFGLEGFGAKSVPSNLPKAKAAPRPVHAPKPAPAPAQTSAPATPSTTTSPHATTRPAPQPAGSLSAAPQAEAAVPPVGPAVALSGPRVAIDRDKLHDGGLLVPEDPVTGLLEEFRIVKRELLADARSIRSDLARRILVCSPHSGEGKTYCAMNLALALAAERDIEVVLIDADVVNPSVTRRLGLEPAAGLMDVLADTSLDPEDVVSPTDIDGLFVMQAGTGSAQDAEYLTSARTGEVLARLTQGAPNRFLIFDTPPALAASPAAELAAHVGQTLLVVRADETSRAALDDARKLLSACPDIKLLLNAVQFSPSGRRFGDYGEREA